MLFFFTTSILFSYGLLLFNQNLNKKKKQQITKWRSKMFENMVSVIHSSPLSAQDQNKKTKVHTIILKTKAHWLRNKYTNLELKFDITQTVKTRAKFL